MATYSDLVTLLMCFFVLLFAFSNIDAKKFEAVMNSFQGGSGPLSGGTSFSEDDSNMDGKPELLEQESTDPTYQPVMLRVDEESREEESPQGKSEDNKTVKLVATNGESKDPSDFEWLSSNPDVAEVDRNGKVEVKKEDQQAVIYAKDKDTGVVGALHINSSAKNAEVPDINNPSKWAEQELNEALKKGLIPDSLKTLDMKAEINRKEFAAVSLSVYQALTKEQVALPAGNPFLDTEDKEVLKAFGIGITNGVEHDLFEPYSPLDREQAATMLTRAYKKAKFKDWTLEKDGDSAYRLDYSNVQVFKDDKDISDWAKPSVYFMVKNGIIEGVGGNMFAPKSYASSERAMAYADMTREQAIVMGLRIVESLGEK